MKINIKYILIIFLIYACNTIGLDDQYKLAEKLFVEKRYKASIHEFDRIINRDPLSDLGIKSLERKAFIQKVYLNDHAAALKTYLLLKSRAKEKNVLAQAYEAIADIHFSKFQNYLESAKYYKVLFNEYNFNKRADYYGYRLGRSLLMLTKFEEAIKVFNLLIKQYKNSSYSDRISLEIGNALSLMGKCKKAIKAYEALSSKTKYDNIKLESKFGIASCYEELNKLDKAYEFLIQLKKDYPDPELIDLKLEVIKKRKISKL